MFGGMISKVPSMVGSYIMLLWAVSLDFFLLILLYATDNSLFICLFDTNKELSLVSMNPNSLV